MPFIEFYILFLFSVECTLTCCYIFQNGQFKDNVSNIRKENTSLVTEVENSYTYEPSRHTLATPSSFKKCNQMC